MIEDINTTSSFWYAPDSFNQQAVYANGYRLARNVRYNTEYVKDVQMGGACLSSARSDVPQFLYVSQSFECLGKKEDKCRVLLSDSFISHGVKYMFALLYVNLFLCGIYQNSNVEHFILFVDNVSNASLLYQIELSKREKIDGVAIRKADLGSTSYSETNMLQQGLYIQYSDDGVHYNSFHDFRLESAVSYSVTSFVMCFDSYRPVLCL